METLISFGLLQVSIGALLIATIGVMITGLTFFFKLTNKRFKTILENQENNTERIDGLDKRIDGLDKRIDGLDKRIDHLESGQKEMLKLIKDILALNT